MIKGISPRSDVLNSRVGVSDVPASPGEIVAGPVGRNGCCQDFATATGCDGGTEGMSGLFVRGGDGDDNPVSA